MKFPIISPYNSPINLPKDYLQVRSRRKSRRCHRKNRTSPRTSAHHGSHLFHNADEKQFQAYGISGNEKDPREMEMSLLLKKIETLEKKISYLNKSNQSKKK